MTSFADLGLSETLLRALREEGYETPTPIQASAIPPLTAGRDVVGIAQTGTGKTAAFVLPLINAAAAERTRPPARGARALILTPTRELATQIADEIARYGRHTRVSRAVVVGGVKPGPQVRTMARGVDILVATPGRLLDHVGTKAIDLSAVRHVVLDEADQMLDLGFMPAIRKIMALVPKARQTVLMSATMPEEIRRLARDFQTDPVEVAVAPVSRPIAQIAQSVVKVDAAGKRDALAKLLSGDDVTRAIVFTRTKHGADKVSRHLETAGFAANAIHGNKSQGQRQRALDAFKSGETPILVATDIAARGIHVDDVSHVINYELPEVAEVYVHRIGRTARAGRAGIAISLCDPAEAKLLRAIVRLTGVPIAGDDAAPAAGSRPAHPPRGAPAPRGKRFEAPRQGQRPAARRSGRPARASAAPSA